MKPSTFAKAASLLAPLFASTSLAQYGDKFTHPATGIEFWRQIITEAQTTGGFEWGYALPESGIGNAEYIGYLVCLLHDTQLFTNSSPNISIGRISEKW